MRVQDISHHNDISGNISGAPDSMLAMGGQWRIPVALNDGTGYIDKSDYRSLGCLLRGRLSPQHLLPTATGMTALPR